MLAIVPLLRISRRGDTTFSVVRAERKVWVVSFVLRYFSSLFTVRLSPRLALSTSRVMVRCGDGSEPIPVLSMVCAMALCEVPVSRASGLDLCLEAAAAGAARAAAHRRELRGMCTCS